MLKQGLGTRPLYTQRLGIDIFKEGFGVFNPLSPEVAEAAFQVQDQGGVSLQPAGILQYVEDLKRGSNTEIEPEKRP